MSHYKEPQLIDLFPALELAIDWMDTEPCGCTNVRRKWMYDQQMTIACVECLDCGTLWELDRYFLPSRHDWR